MTRATARAFFLRHPSTPCPAGWHWRNFRYEELECHDGTGLLLDTGALDKLQLLRDAIRQPLYVTSAYRSVAYNQRIGGAARSYHLSGRAFDIHAKRLPLYDLSLKAIDVGFTGIGYYDSFIHVDDGPRRSWRG